MNPEDKAKELGVEFTKQEPGYLNLCIRTGNLLITSGHTSDAKGVLTDVGDPAFMPRRFKNHQAHIGLFGLGCVTHPNFIRDGNILGHKTGLYVVDEPFSMIEIKSQSEFENYAPILNSWLTMTSEPHRS